jgi:glycosyltransferase involved in cell wall biosynthesis
MPLQQPFKPAALIPYPLYPAKMGGQKGIALFYEHLSKLTPVLFLCAQGNYPKDTAAISPFEIIGKGKRRYFNPGLYFKLRKLIKQEGITHIIFEHPYYAWLIGLLRYTTPCAIAIHSHNIESLRFKSTGSWWWKIMWLYERFAHRKAHINFFITDEDRDYATRHFNLIPNRCHTITYGIEINSAPTTASREKLRKELLQKHGMDADEKLMLFNGTLDYPPNQQAIDNILYHINPLLLSSGIRYKIIICGKNLPASYQNLETFKNKNIIFAGFVEDINLYFMGADIFINPVTTGGGIKTKLVEALAMSMTAVSTETGALGVPSYSAGDNLLLAKDNDWESFTRHIINYSQHRQISSSFFTHFYWGNIVQKAYDILVSKPK